MQGGPREVWRLGFAAILSLGSGGCGDDGGSGSSSTPYLPAFP